MYIVCGTIFNIGITFAIAQLAMTVCTNLKVASPNPPHFF